MKTQRALITGGAGFIGCNLADHLLAQGQQVIVFDDLSRTGTELNLDWLKKKYGDALVFVQGDVRDAKGVLHITQDVDVVFHLAGQTAVTSSVSDPRHDFEVNVIGTFNVLEAVRSARRAPILVYASTNKVYGALHNVPTPEGAPGGLPAGGAIGINEQQPLDFHSPYGCSKGAADQYVRDYARIYGLRTVVLRQSCIYGQRQFGVEDQGWVAWFIIATILGKDITIFGDGKQVRDVLHVKDLIRAYELAVDNIETTAGQVYNIGGGAANAIAIWRDFGPLLESILGAPLEPPRFLPERPGDQRYFVCDTRKAAREFGWSPSISVRAGVSELVHYVQSQQAQISTVLSGR